VTVIVSAVVFVVVAVALIGAFGAVAGILDQALRDEHDEPIVSLEPRAARGDDCAQNWKP